MEDELTNEQKLDIARHCLLSSAPCQYNDVLTDIRKILPDGILTNPLANGIARVYNTRTARVVTAPSSKKVVLSTAGEVDPSHFVDSSDNSVFGVDHLTLVTVADPLPYAVNEALEGRRRALYSALETYLAGNFKPVDTGLSVHATADNKIVVAIASEKPNLRNMWSGRWSSSWTISGDSISGTIKVQAHYFEDGNLQLITNKPVAESSLQVGSSDASFASAVVAFITASENATRAGLEDLFGNINTNTLKAMRRVMPITQTKMQWNVNSVRMNRQIRK